MKFVVITGVSTGIGYAAAQALVERGWHVLGSVRREEDGARLQAEFGELFTPLLFDVTDETAVQRSANEVATVLNGRGLTALINNAGIAVPGPLLNLPLADFRRQLEVNLVAVLSVSQAFLPLLGARKNAGHPPGRIINISSVSGSITYPFMVPYAVSKHGLESLSNGLRRELMIYGIDVIIIAPGSVQTPIWEKANQMDVNQFAESDYVETLATMQQVMVQNGRTGMPVERVTKAILAALESPKPKSRYVLARKWLTGWLLPRWLPDRWIDRIMAARMGLKRQL
jgi:NAD(P)-dependent dehydrogenase (short-subunit alcohol dehydrogenase family)